MLGKLAEFALHLVCSTLVDHLACTMKSFFAQTSCRCNLFGRNNGHTLKARHFSRPSFAPKPIPDLKHIRQNPGLYEQNCIDRNYAQFAKNGWRILELHGKLVDQQREAVQLRQRNNAIGKEVSRHGGMGDNGQGPGAGGQSALLEEAQDLKKQLSLIEAQERGIQEEMEQLALELPNLSSMRTPVGNTPVVLGMVNEHVPREAGPSHVDIGKKLDIVDFEASATTSGWGWYFLKNEGALLEQALIQYALSVAMQRGWQAMTPPSLVYAHIAGACGFAPRDQNGETQIYNLARNAGDSGSDRPDLVLAGTAEIPFAGSQANKTLNAKDFPLKVIGPSRCYRAEAGARGVDTKGLYRVHEFTKVEMFAWSNPPADESDERFGGDISNTFPAEQVFEEMVDIQKEILSSLELHARVLEMPSNDLGASATRKVDIEAFFPSRMSIGDGYGEVTSASICTDYQSRRLGTRLKSSGSGKLSWPHTVNGTALAVPRVLACIIENHWNEKTDSLHLPEVLRQYMPGNIEVIKRA